MANQVTLRALLQSVGITGTQLYVTRPVNSSTLQEVNESRFHVEQSDITDDDDDFDDFDDW